jgi:hypothetical protein
MPSVDHPYWMAEVDAFMAVRRSIDPRYSIRHAIQLRGWRAEHGHEI